MVAPPTEHEILDVNRRYHDVAADSYDAKWGISFGEIGHQQVLGKITKLLGPNPGPFARSLGDRLRARATSRSTCCRPASCGRPPARTSAPACWPRSSATRRSSASRSRPRPATPPSCRSRTRASTSCSATPSCTTCPTSTARFAEFKRVLKPGGMLFFAGEPSRQRRPHRRLPEARRDQGRAAVAQGAQGAARADAPRRARRGRARARGRRRRPRVRPDRPPAPRDRRRASPTSASAGEELLANWFGWFNRTLEATADPQDIPRGWIKYAYRGYILLQRVDRALLEPRLPPRIFYNLMLAARKPG